MENGIRKIAKRNILSCVNTQTFYLRRQVTYPYSIIISSEALRGEAGGAKGAVGRDRAAYIGM